MYSNDDECLAKLVALMRMATVRPAAALAGGGAGAGAGALAGAGAALHAANIYAGRRADLKDNAMQYDWRSMGPVYDAVLVALHKDVAPGK